VARARGFVQEWDTLRGRIDAERFDHVRARLAAQVTHAEEWCRAINGYFSRLSGVPDQHRRPLPASSTP
jgi:alpha-glucuronidase